MIWILLRIVGHFVGLEHEIHTALAVFSNAPDNFCVCQHCEYSWFKTKWLDLGIDFYTFDTKNLTKARRIPQNIKTASQKV